MGNLNRQIHRWLSIAFTFGFALNFTVIVLLGHKTPPPWLYLFAVLPLFLLLPTGLWMFVRPYLGRRSATSGA